MRALIVDSQAPERLALKEVPDPTPGPGQILIRVEAISLNHGELPAANGAADGTLLGWDAAGTVVRAAANGKGPSAGARVVSFGDEGGWAELRAVDVDDVAQLPEGVEIGAASALPVAGVTAVRALRAAGPILGRRVLITGASGGVGRFAVQLAHLGGAYVIGVVGSAARGAGLRELGADEVAVGLHAVTSEVSAVLENVGGAQLLHAFQLLEVGGILLSIGSASHQPTVFPPYSTVGPTRTLQAFKMGSGLASDLQYLLMLLGRGTLDPQVGWRGSWEQAAEASHLLLSRKVAGKAVLKVP